MKLLSKLVNKYTTGLYAVLCSTSALAAPAGNWNPAWVAAGILGIVTVIGIAAVSTNDSDDDQLAS